jgi:hypothetical protein
MREIVIGVPDSKGLLLFLCDVCRRHDWRRNGMSVTPEQALEAAQAMDAAAAGNA